MTALVLAAALAAVSAALLYRAFRLYVRGRAPGEAVILLGAGVVAGVYAVLAFGWFLATVVFR